MKILKIKGVIIIAPFVILTTLLGTIIGKNVAVSTEVHTNSYVALKSPAVELVEIMIEKQYYERLEQAEEIARMHETKLKMKKAKEDEQKAEDSKKKLEKIIGEKANKRKDVDVASRSMTRYAEEVFTVSAYDLSVDSCGKRKGDKYYGTTSTGSNLVGKMREDVMIVASDPKVLPMGTVIEVTFMNDNYKKFNGVYTTDDTGGAIKGNKLDLYLGDFDSEKADQSVWDFGKPKARVKVLRLGGR